MFIPVRTFRRENVRIQRTLNHIREIFPQTNPLFRLIPHFCLLVSKVLFCYTVLFHLCPKHVTQFNAWPGDTHHLFSVRTEPLTYKVIHTHLHACASNVKPSRFFKMVWFGRVWWNIFPRFSHASTWFPVSSEMFGFSGRLLTTYLQCLARFVNTERYFTALQQTFYS